MDSRPGRPKNLKFGAIDTLRGVAAWYVIAFHLIAAGKAPLVVPLWMRPGLLGGVSGVTLFFVLSAFTLAHSYAERVSENGAVASFYIRRVFRIAPLFFSVLITRAICDKLVFHVSHRWLEYALNCTFTFNFFPGWEQGIIWASWTIGVEMIFYAVFPLLFWSGKSIWRSSFFFAVAVLVAELWKQITPRLPLGPDDHGYFFYYSFLHHLPSFALGFVLYACFKRLTAAGGQPAWVVWAFTGVGVTLWIISVYSGERPLSPIFYLQPIAYGAITLALLLKPARWISNGFTRFFGEISYSLYLLHPIVIIWILPPFYRWAYAREWPNGVAFFVCFVATAALLTALATLTHKWIEKPGIRRGSELLKRYIRREAVVKPAAGAASPASSNASQPLAR